MPCFMQHIPQWCPDSWLTNVGITVIQTINCNSSIYILIWGETTHFWGRGYLKNCIASSFPFMLAKSKCCEVVNQVCSSPDLAMLYDAGACALHQVAAIEELLPFQFSFSTPPPQKLCLIKQHQLLLQTKCARMQRRYEVLHVYRPVSCSGETQWFWIFLLYRVIQGS